MYGLSEEGITLFWDITRLVIQEAIILHTTRINKTIPDEKYPYYNTHAT